MSEPAIDILWISAGLSCDGESVAITGATQPSLEDLVLGTLPGLPRVALHHPLLSRATGADFLAPYTAAAAGRAERPFILVVEGSIPNEDLADHGYWAALGNDPVTGEPVKTTTWLDRLAPNAWAVVAAGTCSAYGGIPAMAGNVTGAMGVPDYLGWDFRSRGGLPIVCVPGCPSLPDNMTETLLYLLRQFDAGAPAIPLDAALRPRWLFEHTVHEGCDRAGFYEQADFATELGSPKCIVKQGCWGPVVNCNVGKRGWINGVGGCANVGGICIGCTMPGFPDRFMPFMEEPPGARLSTAAVQTYGRTVRALRMFTRESLDTEPGPRSLLRPRQEKKP